MVTLARRVQRIPFAPVVAVLFGTTAAILVAAVPQWMFESAVVASGLPGFIAAAAPPLGVFARVLAIALAFGAVAGLIMIVLVPAIRLFEAKARPRIPWRDAGYDGYADGTGVDPLPPRRPIFAPDELGAPLMSDAAIASPLVDAEAIFTAEPDLAAPLAVEDLQPVMTAAAQPDQSIAALVRRLEDGLARRGGHGPDFDPDGSGTRATLLSQRGVIAGDADIKPAADGDDTTARATGFQPLGLGRQLARG